MLIEPDDSSPDYTHRRTAIARRAVGALYNAPLAFYNVARRSRHGVPPTMSSPWLIRARRLLAVAGTLTTFILTADSAPAENVVQVPVLAAVETNDRGVFEVLLVWWDQKPEPDPVALQWRYGRVIFRETHLGSMSLAFSYALSRSRSVRPTGTVSVRGVAYSPTSTDGPSAGAVMTVGFIAVLKGEKLLPGVAMTGTIEPDGRIGPVGSIPDKLRAAAREGYRTVLIPQGQLYEPRWNLEALAMELNLAIIEVATVDEAYELMTGQKLEPPT